MIITRYLATYVDWNSFSGLEWLGLAAGTIVFMVIASVFFNFIESFDKPQKTNIQTPVKTDMTPQPIVKRPRKRKAISEAVRHEVWRRDQGRCVDCGSRERLEFDHIVPVSKGGSSTARNIELRCEFCNRSKHDSI